MEEVVRDVRRDLAVERFERRDWRRDRRSASEEETIGSEECQHGERKRRENLTCDLGQLISLDQLRF